MRYSLLKVSLCLTVMLDLSAGAPLSAQHWPQFRGPSGQGHAPRSHPPVKFGEEELLQWKTEIPGRGWSSPVIWENEIWVTTAVGDADDPNRLRLGALGLDALSGKILHRTELFVIDHPEPIHDDNSYASPTPVIDERHLFCHFGTFGTAAVDRRTGNVLWKNESLKVEHQGGPGSSPIGYRDLLIVTCDGANAQYVVALRKQDGTQAWIRHRSAPHRPDPITHRAFSTPLLWTDNGEDLLISPAADQVHAYRPESGAEVWHVRYTGFSNVPAPVTHEDLVFVCTGFFEPALAAIRRGGSGDVTQTHVPWFVSRGVSTLPSPIVVSGRIYALNEGGILTCLDCQTGKVIRKRRFVGNYSASPVSAGDKLYFCSEEGKITVLEPNDSLDILQVNRVNGIIKASPAVVGNRFYIRTENHLYCFAEN
ncbi:MAG: PQQ-binding-like beta-propeller repeat protein [Planctomycetaceae bacterium]|nr:PQQ-binding-like beta-propeller repeat protein [Planctomycetaceae bacterium]